MDGDLKEPHHDDIVFLKGDFNQERVSVDLNIKRNSNYVFPHHRVKHLDRVRSFELGNGRLVITPAVGEKAPTIACFRVFVILLALAKEQGLETNKVHFTSRLIAKILKTPMTGAFAKRLAGYLNSLTMTTFVWFESFETASGTRETITNFHLIDSFNYQTFKERVALKKQFDSHYSVRINQDLFENLKAGKVAFVNLDTLLMFRSGLSEVFYLRVDTILCAKEYEQRPLELRSETVIKALQLDDVLEYRHVSRRKRVLAAIQRECNDKTLSNGNLLKVELLPTVDGKDWKLRCYQIATAINYPKFLPVNSDANHVEYLADLITEATGQPEHRAWHVWVAKHYATHHVMRAIAELKQEPPQNMRNKGAVFTAKLKSIISRAGLAWSKPDTTHSTSTESVSSTNHKKPLH